MADFGLALFEGVEALVGLATGVVEALVGGAVVVVDALVGGAVVVVGAFFGLALGFLDGADGS